MAQGVLGTLSDLLPHVNNRSDFGTPLHWLLSVLGPMGRKPGLEAVQQFVGQVGQMGQIKEFVQGGRDSNGFRRRVLDPTPQSTLQISGFSLDFGNLIPKGVLD